ncbi:MAG: hypothetical protein V3S24_13115 [Candidatus Tectomicrobia bacterium]
MRILPPGAVPIEVEMRKENSYHIEWVEPRDLAALKVIEEVQVAAWPDSRIAPAHVLEILAETGGQLLAARTDDTHQIIGFALAFLAKNDGPVKHPGIPEDELFIASYMVGVLPEHQGGLGYELKQAQRYHALRRGIRWMQWTYYPMSTRNGALNFRKLGGCSYKFVPNKYGMHSSGLPTDRLIVLWDMQHPGPVPFPHACVPLTRRDSDWKPVLDEKALDAAAVGTGPPALICSVPIEFVKLRERDIDAACAWQDIFGQVATTLLTAEAHWSVANFRVSEDKEEGHYLFIRYDASEKQ